MSCAVTCATDGGQDYEINCLKESKPCHKGQRLSREKLQLINTEKFNPFVVDDADVDSLNPEIMTVEEDEDGDEDDDVEINI